VLIREGKVAGILAQFVDGYILAGIGINVNQTSFPEGLRTPATSLLIESGGRRQSRENTIVQLLSALDTYCSLLLEQGPASIVRLFTAGSSYALHRRVVAEATAAEGVTAGLDHNGFLLVRLDNGRLERITSGGIRPATGLGKR
jgi:BirA family biotin operon repressor/biotin-[acetyl-CoA-carboxylase] ligase